MTLIELAERVEAAEGPCRLLDAEIGAYLQRERVRAAGHAGSAIRADEQDPGHITESLGCGWWAPRYTASIDAAMTLVPEGWNFEVDRIGGRGGAVVNKSVLSRDAFIAQAATPALALCAAALRAQWDTYAKHQDRHGLGPKDSGPVGRQADAPKGGNHDSI